MTTNIMSVDLEDHFCDLPYAVWQNYESRIIHTAKVVLDLFEKYKVHATFFTLGYIAEKHPELIEKIKSKGHELASHGYAHLDIRKITKEIFESDLTKSLGILKKITGEKILGFRAPWFSINKTNLWVFDILRKYLVYDSSIFPVGLHYGMSTAQRHMYRISKIDPLIDDPTSKFVEIPLATLRLPFFGNIPIAGGIYLRILQCSNIVVQYGSIV